VELRPSIRGWSLAVAMAAYGHLGRLDQADRLFDRASRPTAGYIATIVNLFRTAEDRELLRSGLALAGADV
jgi:hypothetical protein